MPRFDTVYWPGLDPGHLASSKLSITDTNNALSATNVDAAIDELAANYAASAAHLTATLDAHDATAISIVDAPGNYSGVNVEAALSEAGARILTNEGDITTLQGTSSTLVTDVNTIESDLAGSTSVNFGWKTDWTPTFQANGYAAATAGNGTWTARYLRIGNAGWISAKFVTGSTSSIFTTVSPSIDMPSGWTASGPALGHIVMSASGTASNFGQLVLTVGDTIHGYSTSRGSMSVIHSWLPAANAASTFSQYGYCGVVGGSPAAGWVVLYTMGPIPLV